MDLSNAFCQFGDDRGAVFSDINFFHGLAENEESDLICRKGRAEKRTRKKRKICTVQMWSLI